MAWQLDPHRVLYLRDPSPTAWETTVASFQPAEDAQASIELEQTPFYPQSGGQPSDRGTIRWTTGCLDVEKVVYGGTGEVRHIGQLRGEAPSAQAIVSAEIDAGLRMLHARLHTAGELICVAVSAMGHQWPVFGAKHFPGDARVVFALPSVPPSTLDFQQALGRRLDQLVAGGGQTKVMLLADRADAVRHVMNVAELPDASSLYRIVIVHGERGRPCTGTHVKTLAAVGAIEIRGVKAKKGHLFVSYGLNG